MLYIKTLIICDKDDQVIFKIARQPAVEGLQQALQIVNEKDGPKSFRKILSTYMDQLDKEFKDYFNMG
jgi:hypothetical protein